MPARRVKIYFDGGARPNPGQIEAAVVVRGVAQVFTDLGQGSNLDAEWLALIAALRVAHSLGEAEFDLIGDAAHVIDRANGTRPCRDAAQQAHLAAFRELAAVLAPRRIRWIARRQNLAGIVLLARHAR